MISARLVSRILVFAAAAAIVGGALPLMAFDDSLRPEISVADGASGCPSVEGAFVVLLDPSRGMLLLSAAPFPGGHPVGDARGTELKVSLPGKGTWNLAQAGSSAGQVPLWGARYPFLAESGRGCVGFDRQHWSSEGDLVTYARWLVEEVYLQLPAEERQRRPDFRIANREVAFAVQRPGYGTFQLKGKEGATRACKYEDSGRIYLFMPFVLDEPAGRIAVKVEYTDGSYFDTEAKSSLGWTIVAPEEPGTVADTSFVILAEGVTAAGTE